MSKGVKILLVLVAISSLLVGCGPVNVTVDDVNVTSSVSAAPTPTVTVTVTPSPIVAEEPGTEPVTDNPTTEPSPVASNEEPTEEPSPEPTAASNEPTEPHDEEPPTEPSPEPTPEIHRLSVEEIVTNIPVSSYYVGNTVDGSRSTFLTTETLFLGRMFYVSYKLSELASLTSIEIVDDYTNQYSLGELVISVSSDSTDGINGTWTTIATSNARITNALNGDWAIDVTSDPIRYVKLEMTYQGDGAFGGTPSFYLSEITFNGR